MDVARASPSKEAMKRNKENKMKSTESKPSIVFVHGIWADGSSFSKVIPTLQSEGHQVLATQHGLDSLSARTKIFLYVKILSTFADSQPSLFTTLINTKDWLTGAIYST